MDIQHKKHQLYELISKENSLTGILNAAREVIRYPILLIDTSYKLLAHSYNSVSDDPLWNEIISHGTFSHETVDFFNNEGFIEAYASDTVVIMKSPKLKYDRINCTIYDSEGMQTGSFCAVACEKLIEDDDFVLIEALGEFLGKNITLNELNSRREEEKAIGALIEGHHTDKDKKALKDNGFDGRQYIAVVDVVRYENTLTHLEYFCDLFSKIESRFKYYPYLNNIIILMKFDEPIGSIRGELAALDEFFHKYNIFAGVSGSFNDICGLKKYFRQALNALNYCVRLNDDKRIFLFDDYRLELTLNYDLDLTEVCHPTALNMLLYDITNNTKYSDIFYDYCKNAIIAKNENVDLKPIKDLFHIDFSDDDSLFSIFISIKYIRLYPEKIEKFLSIINKKEYFNENLQRFIAH